MTAVPTIPPSSPTPANKNRPKNIFAAEFVRPALARLVHQARPAQRQSAIR